MGRQKKNTRPACRRGRLSWDEYFFLQAEKAREKSNCLKIQTGVVIVKKGAIISQGANLCSPEGFKHGKKVTSCPRMNLATGVNYEACKSLHAELLAILEAGAKNCQGAVMYLSGHYYPCWHCESIAHLVGIREIKVKDKDAKNFYIKKRNKDRNC